MKVLSSFGCPGWYSWVLKVGIFKSGNSRKLQCSFECFKLCYIWKTASPINNFCFFCENFAYAMHNNYILPLRLNSLTQKFYHLFRNHYGLFMLNIKSQTWLVAELLKIIAFRDLMARSVRQNLNQSERDKPVTWPGTANENAKNPA